MPTEVVCRRLETTQDIYYIPKLASFLDTEPLSPLHVEEESRDINIHHTAHPHCI